jgi:hypothetical protein
MVCAYGVRMACVWYVRGRGGICVSCKEMSACVWSETAKHIIHKRGTCMRGEATRVSICVCMGEEGERTTHIHIRMLRAEGEEEEHTTQTRTCKHRA